MHVFNKSQCTAFEGLIRTQYWSDCRSHIALARQDSAVRRPATGGGVGGGTGGGVRAATSVSVAVPRLARSW